MRSLLRHTLWNCLDIGILSSDWHHVVRISLSPEAESFGTYRSRGATLVRLAAPATAPERKYEETRKLDVALAVEPACACCLEGTGLAGLGFPGGVALAMAEAAEVLPLLGLLMDADVLVIVALAVIVSALVMLVLAAGSSDGLQEDLQQARAGSYTHSARVLSIYASRKPGGNSEGKSGSLGNRAACSLISARTVQAVRYAILREMPEQECLQQPGSKASYVLRSSG